jgi:hypothetical protein
MGRIAAAAALVVLLPAGATAAPADDLVVLVNGDRMTGEVKELARGRLSVKTPALDTVRVYWGQIDGLSTDRVFEVQTGSGDRYFGSLAHVGKRRVLVTPSGGQGVELSLDDIVGMAPFNATFWERIDGHVDLGFSFAKAELETTWSLNTDAVYRSRVWVVQGNLSSQLTFRQDADQLSRNVLSVLASRALGRHWFGLGLGQLQENEELSLELRSLAGGGFGRHLVRSESTRLQAYAGVVYTREEYAREPVRNSPELAVGTNWDWFTTSSNNLNLSTIALSYFAVTGQSRARLEVQSAFRVKFLSDFYFSVNGYESYDSSPPEGRATTDLGITLSLGWKFGSLGAF